MIILKKYMLTVGILVIYALLAFVYPCHAAVILSYGKSYTITPKLNYQLTAPATDCCLLTDGKYSEGSSFWVQKTTAGWEATKTIEIVIDLDKVSTIGSISFNTARGEHSGVYFPKHVAAFVGSDMEHFEYVGDIAHSIENLPGEYKIKRFVLDKIGVAGRYVLLVFQPKGTYFFCDEIEVTEGGQAAQGNGSLNKSEALDFYSQLIWFDDHRDFVESAAEEFKSELSVNQLLKDHLSIISKNILLFKSIEDIDIAKAEIAKLRQELLFARFPEKPLLIEIIEPWAPLSMFSLPSGVTKELFVTVPQGGSGYASFIMTNLLPTIQKLDVNIAQIPECVSELSLREVPFVKSATGEFVADPLVLINGSVSLRPGETKMVFVSAKGFHSGNCKTSLTVSNATITSVLPLNFQVLNVALPTEFSLNSVNWAYLDLPLIKDRKEQAVADLLAHHTNVIVVPPGYLSTYGPTYDPLFISLEKYLNRHKGAAKVLFFSDFSIVKRVTVDGKYAFMDAEWQEWFKKWYASLVLAANRAGFAENQIFLYPYDEMGGEQIDNFVRLAQWARKDIPTIKFYATFGEATLKSKQWEKALPYLAIVQSYDEKMFSGRDNLKTEAWIYDTGGNSRSLSPHTYYRLMAWKAFLKGYTGVGFWAYADTGKDTTAWKELDRDFVVIYDGENQSIISSRRWEAWRMGIEDYELLIMYARFKGVGAARALALDVIDNPGDTVRADIVRRKILSELSNSDSAQQPVINRIMIN